MSAFDGLYDVRPGDLCFTRIGGFVPGVVPVAAGMLLLGERVRIGRVRFDHVGIVTEPAHRTLGTAYLPPRMAQAMPDGAEEIDLRLPTHWNPWTVFCRLPEDFPGQALDAAVVARAMVAAEVDYSFGSYVMLAAWKYGIKTPRLAARIDRRLPPRRMDFAHGTVARALPAEAICSVLVDQAWTLAGKRVMRGTAPQVVTPGALALQLWNRAGVEWGGATVSG